MAMAPVCGGNCGGGLAHSRGGEPNLFGWEPKRRKDKPTAQAPKCTWLNDLATNHNLGSNEGVVKITRLEAWVTTLALSSTSNKVKS